MDTVVVQYVGYGSSYYYPSSIPGIHGTGTDSILRLLQAADGLGMDVYLGLQLNTGDFDPHAEPLTRRPPTLTELESRYGSHASLTGWYVPQELSDQIVFNDPTLRDNLVNYVGQISTQAHTDTQRPVMISPYFGQTPDVAAYADWWDTTGFPGMGGDILAMQDGVGTHRTTIAESLPVYQALAPVAQSHNVAFWANNESFNQTHGWPVDEQAWASEPTDIATFTAQIASTSPYVDKSITFEFSHYMSPQAGAEADVLYQDYAAYLDGTADQAIPIAGYTYDNPATTSFHTVGTRPGPYAADRRHPRFIGGRAGQCVCQRHLGGPDQRCAGRRPAAPRRAGPGGQLPRRFGRGVLPGFQHHLTSSRPSPCQASPMRLTIETSTDGTTFAVAASHQ